MAVLVMTIKLMAGLSWHGRKSSTAPKIWAVYAAYFLQYLREMRSWCCLCDNRPVIAPSGRANQQCLPQPPIIMHSLWFRLLPATPLLRQITSTSSPPRGLPAKITPPRSQTVVENIEPSAQLPHIYNSSSPLLSSPLPSLPPSPPSRLSSFFWWQRHFVWRKEWLPGEVMPAVAAGRVGGT